MSVQINEIYENAKLAREQALVGNYEMSTVSVLELIFREIVMFINYLLALQFLLQVYYQGVVQQIHRLLATIIDPMRKTRWQEVSYFKGNL